MREITSGDQILIQVSWRIKPNTSSYLIRRSSSSPAPSSIRIYSWFGCWCYCCTSLLSEQLTWLKDMPHKTSVDGSDDSLIIYMRRRGSSKMNVWFDDRKSIAWRIVRSISDVTSHQKEILKRIMTNINFRLPPHHDLNSQQKFH